MKRYLACLLALCLLLGAVPFYGFATEEENSLANRKNNTSAVAEQIVGAATALTTTKSTITMGTKPSDGTTTGNPFIQNTTGGSTSFRIPALVTLENGTLVAAADARWNTNYDGGGLDTVVARSTNDGANWSYTFANYLGDNGNAYSGLSSCFIDPALAADGNTVYMLVDLYPHGIALNGSGNTQPSTAVGFYDNDKLKLTKDSAAYYLDLTNYSIYPEAGGTPVSGYTVDKYFNITGNDGTNTNLFLADSPFQVVRTGYLYLTKSTDGGATWSAPKLLNLKTSSERVCLVGPGRGLVTSSGMIVFPVYSYNGSSESQKTSFVYSTDGGNTWKRSSDFNGASWSSESAVVELSDGTLRFFYRNGTSQLYYADYANGTWGSPVSTGIATNSNTQISAITYSKTIGGKQVILVSCPAGPNNNGHDNSGASYRVNGKIFVFTVAGNKSMTRVGTIDITSKHNATTNYFLYSCLTELNNGKVGILFEDNVSDYSNPPYCELSYETHDIAQELNLNFDTPVVDTNNSLSNQGVTVNFGATEVAGWTMKVIPNQTVGALGSAEYSAFDVTITDNKGNSYTGAAEVKLPLGELMDSVGLYPFVVGANGIEKITPYSISNGYITFTAPHFSVMGVAADPTLITNTVDVTLKVGETSPVYTDNTGNYADAATNMQPDGSVATMQLQGSIEAANKELVAVTDPASFSADKKYIIVSARAATADPTASVLTAESYTSNAADWLGTLTGLAMNGPASIDNSTVWTITPSGTGYTISSGDKYLEIGYKSASMSTTQEVLTMSYTTNTAYYQYSGWLISEETNYLADLAGTTLKGAFGWNETHDGGAPWKIYEVVETGETAATKVTFTGVSAGTATAVVGTTQYNITVNNRDKVENVTLKVGQSATYTDDTGNYENDPNTIAPNAGVATMTVTGVGTGGVTIEEMDTVGMDDEFYIQVNDGEYLKSDYTTTTNLNEAQKWYVEFATSYYCLVRSGINSGVYLGDSDLDRTVRISQSKVYLKMSDGKLVGYYSNSPVGTPVQVTGDATSQTEITFTGVAEGKTTAVVGDTQYNITVTGYETRDIVLYVGNSYTDVIAGAAYTDADIIETPNASIATLGSITSGKLTGVTSLDQLTDGQYLIVNTATGTVLTSTAADIYGNYGLKYGLEVATEDLTQSQNLWTITQQDGKYFLSRDGQYLTIGGYHAEMTGEAAELILQYTAGFGWSIGGEFAAHGDDIFYLHDGVGDGYENAALGSSNLSNKGYWKIYKINNDTIETSTEVVFTGVKQGTTTAKVGVITYNITVLEVPELVSRDTTPFTANVNQGVAGEPELIAPVTKLTTSVGTRFDIDLGIAGTDVRWVTQDPTVATVDENGVVTGTGLGETTLICYVDGKAYAMPITVAKEPTTNSKRLYSIYIDQVIDTSVYYSWHADGNLIQAEVGEMIRVESDSNHACGISFYGAPDKGYALTFMNATNSDGQYLALQDKEDPTKCDYYTTAGAAGDNMIELYGADTVKNDIAAAIAKGCDGAQGFSREEGNTYRVTSQLTFISEKIVEITKEIEGVLATTKLQANYRHYYPGMVAGAGEMLYYKITVTMERPRSWKLDANKNPTNFSSLEYENAKLEETMQDAYFYTKEQDLLDGKWEGELPKDLQTKVIDITAALNKEWADDEEVRVLEYYVVYKIKDSDIPKFELQNHLRFTYDYNAVFSSADEITATAAAHAMISVVSEPLKDVVIDTPQPMTITGLDNKHLKFAFCDEDSGTPEQPLYTANYGTVSVTKKPVYQKDNNGNLVLDGNGQPVQETDVEGYLLYTYTLTYTPDPSKGILTEPDSVLIYGMVPDVNDNGTPKYKIVNGFNVFPATTVYYEENYIQWDGWDAVGTSTLPTTDEENDAWYVDFVGDNEKRHNYGYEPVYEGSNQASAGTYVTTSTYGATGTFDFVGTGFEIYANCDEGTGVVLVRALNNDTGNSLIYMVDTVVGAGSTDATTGQTGSFYSLPIVSARDLPHGSYTVTILKYVDLDENGEILNAGKPVNIDGVRIIQTMNPATSEDYFKVDGEKNPSFVELRDLVLTGANVENKVAETEYSVADKIVSQVYSDVETLNAVVVINTNPNYVIDNNLQDLLDNGPKNELYLWPGQAVTFTLSDGVTAQIGMKTVKGSSVDYTYNGANYTMNSSTNMFYHENAQGAVTIANTGSGILSITMLKYWGGTQATMLAEVDEEQVVYALRMLRGAAASQPETTLHVSLVDYAGNTLASGELIRNWESDEAVFTSEEILAAVQIPEGYALANEGGLRNVCVAAGETGYVQILVGKVATLQVIYVTMYNQTTIQFGEDAVNLPGRTSTTVTLTKVQTDDGDAVFTMAELRAAAPAGTTMRGLRDVSVPYGQTQTITFFGSPATRTRAAAQWLLTQKAY